MICSLLLKLHCSMILFLLWIQNKISRWRWWWSCNIHSLLWETRENTTCYRTSVSEITILPKINDLIGRGFTFALNWNSTKDAKIIKLFDITSLTDQTGNNKNIKPFPPFKYKVKISWWFPFFFNKIIFENTIKQTEQRINESNLIFGIYCHTARILHRVRCRYD